MPAPIGNQNAIGNNGGRPEEFDKVAVAAALIEWAKRDDSINLNKFCAYHDPIINPRSMLRWAHEDVEFCRAYEKAKSFLGFRREEKLSSGELHSKAYDLNATVYDQFHRAEKIALDDMESDRKVKQIAAGTEEDRQRVEAMTKQIDKAQKERQSSSETKP